MKINIGEYKKYWGPYQLAELLEYLGFNDKQVRNIGKKLSGIKVVVDLCEWIESKRTRKCKIHIHKYDVWSMDNTLACVILPMLVMLKETSIGAPFVDDSDVPPYLVSTEVDKDGLCVHHFKRWDYVIDEMIWAFKQKQPECDWDQIYYTDTKVNWEGMSIHQDRITNGLRLFGKYYENLWV